MLVKRVGFGPVYVTLPEQLGDPTTGVAIWELFDRAHSGMPAKVVTGFSIAPSPLGRNLLGPEFPVWRIRQSAYKSFLNTAGSSSITYRPRALDVPELESQLKPEPELQA